MINTMDYTKNMESKNHTANDIIFALENKR